MGKRKVAPVRAHEGRGAEAEPLEPGLVIEGEAQADEALAELGEFERELLALQNERAEKIAGVTGAYKDAELELTLAIAAHSDALMVWYRGAYGEEGSLKLRHGTAGYRKSRAVELPADEAGLLKALRARGLETCIKTTEKPLKEAIGRLPAKVMAALGAKVIERASWFVKTIKPDTEQGGS